MTTTLTTNYGLPIPPLGATGIADQYDLKMQAADDALKTALDAAVARANHTGSDLRNYTGLADHEYIGDTIPGVAGTDLSTAVGKVVYEGSDGKWELAKGDAVGTMSNYPKLVVAGGVENAAITLLERGYFRDDSLDCDTVGAAIYVDRTTAGKVTKTAPSTVGDQLQVLGKYAYNNVAVKIIEFDPDKSIAEIGNGFTIPIGGTIASSATPYPSSDGTGTGSAVEFFTITALAAAAELQAPVGSPTNGQRLLVRITSDATPRALTYNAIYRASSDLALPVTTVASKTLYMNFIYNSAISKWDFTGYINNF